MEIRDRILNLVRKVSGNENADLWTLQFDDMDYNRTSGEIITRNVSGSIRMQEGRLKTREDLEKSTKKVVSHLPHLK